MNMNHKQDDVLEHRAETSLGTRTKLYNNLLLDYIVCHIIIEAFLLHRVKCHVDNFS